LISVSVSAQSSQRQYSCGFDNEITLAKAGEREARSDEADLMVAADERSEYNSLGAFACILDAWRIAP
jgi:hypothetical protein